MLEYRKAEVVNLTRKKILDGTYAGKRCFYTKVRLSYWVKQKSLDLQGFFVCGWW